MSEKSPNRKQSSGVKKVAGFSLFLLFVFVPLIRAEKLSYSLAVDEELFKTVAITIDVAETSQKRLVFSMPIWIPGSYTVKPFGENVMNFRASSGENRSLPVTRLSREDWEVQSGGNDEISVNYDLLISNGGLIGEGLDSSGALLQAASTWMYVRDLENLPAEVRISAPMGWQIATGMTENDHQSAFTVHDYDELADCPIFMGDLDDTLFYHLGKPHEIYFRGKADFDRPAFVAMVEKIVRYQTGLFNDVPYDRFVFQYTLRDDRIGGGGLEHLNSTSIVLSAPQLISDVHSAASITAHEFFHLWNVKRISSDQLIPLRYDREPRMESLWWLEGVTSYYADLTLVRTGIWSVEEFLEHQEKEIVTLRQNPDRLVTSVAEASWAIWENGYYSQKISYYNKGQLIGLVLDLTIRKVTQNRKSLDDVLIYLYDNYGRRSRGFSDNELESVVDKITGTGFGPFFDRYVTGLVEIPFEELLLFAGLRAEILEKKTPTIGRVRFLSDNNRIYSIDSKSAASKAGLRRSDQLVMADGEKITSQEKLAEIIENKSIGDTLRVLALRDGFEMSFDVVVDCFDQVECTIDILKEATPEQLAIRNGLLTGK